MISARFLHRPRLWLVLFCALLWAPGFFTLPPMDRDESRFAQASRQMLETGDFVRILNGPEPRNRKPIGIYWMQAPAAALARALGLATENPIWPYRIPSLLGALVAVLATFELGLALFGDRPTALAAGAMLAACTLLTAEAHTAKTDAALLGITTLAMLALCRAWRAGGEAVPLRTRLMFWGAIGLGILLKGPVTPMVAGLAALSLSIADRRGAWLLALRPVSGLAVAALIVLPWFIAIELATHGQFFAEAVGGDLGAKLAGGDDAHGAPPGYNLLLLPMMTFPSLLPVLAAWPAAWADRRNEATRFLLAWLIPAWLIFEAVPTKLPHYVLPLYPALFLLAARSWVMPGRPSPAWLRRLAMLAFGAATAVIGLGAAAVPIWLGLDWWLGLPSLVTAALVGLLALCRRQGAALLAMIAFYAAFLGLEVPRLSPVWIAPRVAELLRRAPADDPPGVAIIGLAEPSLRFELGTATRFMPHGQQGAAMLALHEVGRVLIEGAFLDAFLQEAARLGIAPRALGTVSGFNYSRGRKASLTLFDLPPPMPHAPAAKGSIG